MSSLTKVQNNLSEFISPEKEQMIRNVICKGASQDEIDVFLMVCRHVRLDPIMKQIYLVPRWDSEARKNVYTAQTSIDGFRLIADRTGRYAPGGRPVFEYKNDKLFSATSFIKKQTSDGTWHIVEATAFYDEYVQKKKDGTVTKFWNEKEHLMLAKCAESLCFRKAFPNEFSNLHTEDELARDTVDVTTELEKTISQDQLNHLYEMSVQLPDLTQKINDYFKIKSFSQLNQRQYEIVLERLTKGIEELSIKKESESQKIQDMRAAMDGE